MSKYTELFKDPRWQKKRLEILERDEWKCLLCVDKKQTLHVHHKWYIRGLKPWEYANSCLMTMCDECHSFEHSIKEVSIQTLVKSCLSKGYMYSDFADLANDIPWKVK